MPQTETLYRGQALTYRCYEGRPTNDPSPTIVWTTASAA